MLALAFFIAAVTVAPLPAAPPDAAVIVNSGSTNARGYRIVVRPGGSALVSRQAEVTTIGIVSRETATRFFADLAAAAPLDAIGGAPCLKSASFGVRITVAWHGTQSPDLACPTGPAGRTLLCDIGTIERELDIRRSPPRLHLKPGAVPTPSP